ncbi:MAG: hypothetical protein ACPL6F_00230 [Anaerolineales bacterium]
MIPKETNYQKIEDGILLESGWLWGSLSNGQLFVIKINDVTIKLRDGTFLVEYLPPNPGWIYLSTGNAEISFYNKLFPINQHQIAFFNSDYLIPPMNYDPMTLALLRSSKVPDLPFISQPTLKENLQGIFQKIGIDFLQITTLLVYIAAICILISLPIIFVMIKIKKN